MNKNRAALEVLFTPTEFAALAARDLSDTVCVVFDVFRATSTIITALANGATGIVPVAEISEAVAIRRQRAEVLLAGEREGLRIRAAQADGIEFDLGNSPREFSADRVQGKTIAISTTNGSRALRACAPAREVLVGSFLNLGATANYLRTTATAKILLVCSGTGEQVAFEDVLGAGALACLLWPVDGEQISDAAQVARQIYTQHQDDLLESVASSRNGRRLLRMPDLCGDVPWCLQRDRFPIVARMEKGEVIVLRGQI